jgi:hypothetical protein
VRDSENATIGLRRRRGITHVADAVGIRVRLVAVRVGRAVVLLVCHAVPIGITLRTVAWVGITHFTNPILVGELIEIGVKRAVVVGVGDSVVVCVGRAISDGQPSGIRDLSVHQGISIPKAAIHDSEGEDVVAIVAAQ